MRLEGNVIIVTGAATGIGRGIAEVTAIEGASLLLVDLDPRVEEVASTLGCPAIVGDVTDESLAASAVQLAVDQLGAVTGLVNNAAVLYEESIVEMSRETWNQTLDVNLTAPWLWARAVIPGMVSLSTGSVVNVASIESTRVRPGHAAYVAAKTGLLGLTRAIAVEHGRDGVRCNSISPGSIDTEMFRTYVGMSPDPQALESQLIGMNYAGRLGSVEDIGRLAVYLLSDESGFVNGADFVIDGARIAAT